MELYNGDCLEIMKDLSDNSIDLLFCDLPYCGITNSKKDSEISCKWNTPVDLNLFWKQINRICKAECPMFFTCSTKFGVSLINSNPKNFRYDLVWVKSSPCGFLNAKKMPMKKHEMVYVFYNKLPKVYTENIAEHHTHKFIKETENKRNGKDGVENRTYMNRSKTETSNKYDPPLPTSVIKVRKSVQAGEHLYGDSKESPIGTYDPPLPTSVIKHPPRKAGIKNPYGDMVGSEKGNYDPPLPNSILEIASQKGKHATQKPVDLIKWCLKYYSKEGDVVLDPTMGSGSTGVACKDMNRHFIGFEMDEDIYKVACDRLKIEI